MVDLKKSIRKIKEEVNASIQEVLDTNTYINQFIGSSISGRFRKIFGSKTRNSMC